MLFADCFGDALKQILNLADLKNSVLATYLQYDVSYISKWTGHKALPSEKNLGKIVDDIYRCVADSATEFSQQKLFHFFRVSSMAELESTMKEYLFTSYRTQMNLTSNAESTSHFYASELMIHTAKRIGTFWEDENSCELYAILIADLLQLEHEGRLILAGISNGKFSLSDLHKEFHYAIMLDLANSRDPVYDSIFIIHMLTSYSHMDFQLYQGDSAGQKLLFSLKSKRCVTANIIDHHQCLAITESDSVTESDNLYHQLSCLCTQENLIFKRTTMQELLWNNYYVQSMLSNHLRWVLGHMTEQFIPVEIEETILNQFHMEDDATITCIKNASKWTKGVLESCNIEILIYRSALSKFVASGELDYYNHKMILNVEQRIQTLQYLSTCLLWHNLNFKVINGNLSSDFQYVSNPCLFLSDTGCYLRLENDLYQNNILTVNNHQMFQLFREFHDSIFHSKEELIIKDKKDISSIIDQYITQLNALK